jgi:PilZ domain
VTVHLGGGRAPLHAVVEEASSRLIRLTLPSATAALQTRELRAEPAVLEYTTSRGMHRVSGTVDGSTEDPAVVLLHRDHDVDDDVVQRRDFARVAAAVPVQVTISSPLRGAASTTTLNLSAGGLSFVDPIGLPSGVYVDVDIEIAPGSAPIRARGEIVRAVGEDAKGVRIASITREDRERLVRFVSERQRVAVRIAKGG